MSMKRLAYILYVVAVLLISGLTRAHAEVAPFATEHQVPVHIGSVTVAAGKLQLTIRGFLPNPSFGLPSVSVESFDNNVLLLRVTAEAPAAGRMYELRYQEYVATVDVPTLVQGLALPVNANATYLIKTDGYEFALSVSGSDLLKK